MRHGDDAGFASTSMKPDGGFQRGLGRGHQSQSADSVDQRNSVEESSASIYCRSDSSLSAFK